MQYERKYVASLHGIKSDPAHTTNMITHIIIGLRCANNAATSLIFCCSYPNIFKALLVTRLHNRGAESPSLGQGAKLLARSGGANSYMRGRLLSPVDRSIVVRHLVA